MFSASSVLPYIVVICDFYTKLTNSFHFIGTQPENLYVTDRAVISCKFCNRIYLSFSNTSN